LSGIADTVAAGRDRALTAPEAERAQLNWLVPISGLLAAVPVISSTVRGLVEGAAPLGDRAFEATRSVDVLTLHPPALGEFSAASNTVGHAAFSPGPTLFWLLALPARIGPAGLTVWMGAVNVLSIMGAVWLAHRRGGRPLMFATAIAIALMTGSLSSETWHDIINPAAALAPFLFLIFVCWSLACGEYRWLPAAVLLVCFASQAHVTFALPSAALLAVGIGGLVLARRRMRSGDGDAAAGTRSTGSVRPWALAAVVIALVCWAPPLAQQASHALGIKPGPGNMALDLRLAFAHGASVGYGNGWHALVRAAGIPPWWLRPPRTIQQRVFADVYGAPSVFSSLSCLLILAALVLCTVVAVRRGRHELAAAGVGALALCAAVLVSTANTPAAGGAFLTLAYSLWWTAPGGMWIWLVLGFSVIALMPPLRRPGWLRLELSAGVASLAAVVCVALVGALVALGQAPDDDQGAYGPIAQVDARLGSIHPLRQPVLVRSTETDPPLVLSAVDLEASVIYNLRRAGYAVKTDEWRSLGNPYKPGSGPVGSVVTIHSGGQPAPAGGQVVAHVFWASAGLPRGAPFTVTMAPGQLR
jgi:hypothetical protein